MNENFCISLGNVLSCMFEKHQEFADDDIDVLTESGCRMLCIKQGETFIKQGFPIDSVFLVVQGITRIVCCGSNGQMSIQDRLSTPQIYGMTELFNNQKLFTASVLADTQTQALSVPANLFYEAVLSNHTAAHMVILYLNFLTVRNMNFVEVQSLHSLRETLMMYLFNRCRENDLPYVENTTRKMLAETLHINLRSLYRYIDDLQAAGCLALCRGKITINRAQYEKLAACCEEL
ncbi:MAG: Crp/Fnr family transcriptional regulator [Ruthenibacterium sp.]